MSRAFRTDWLHAIADAARAELVASGRFAYGYWVHDPIAFIRRAAKVLT